MVKVYQRKSGELLEQAEYRSALVHKLYQSSLGKYFLPILTHPFTSHLLTLYDYTPFSKRKIQMFCQAFDISLTDFEESDYPHFAAFFQRRIRAEKRPVCSEPSILAVADAKLQVFEIDQNLMLEIKGQKYHIEELLLSKKLAHQFQGGFALVYRLGVEDYHRYLATETGEIIQQKSIKGALHTVREVAQKQYLVYKENKRQYCLIDTEIGPVLQMEIGALLVGRIYNHPSSHLLRGEEKGYFGLGGSTIVVLYPAQRIQLDEELKKYSELGIEIQVYMGEKIGEKLCLND